MKMSGVLHILCFLYTIEFLYVTIEESGFTEKCSQIQNPNLQNQSVEDLMDEFKHLME